jgi:hypothetical protein
MHYINGNCDEIYNTTTGRTLVGTVLRIYMSFDAGRLFLLLNSFCCPRKPHGCFSGYTDALLTQDGGITGDQQTSCFLHFCDHYSTHYKIIGINGSPKLQGLTSINGARYESSKDARKERRRQHAMYQGFGRMIT